MTNASLMTDGEGEDRYLSSPSPSVVGEVMIFGVGAVLSVESSRLCDETRGNALGPRSQGSPEALYHLEGSTRLADDMFPQSQPTLVVPILSRFLNSEDS